MTDTVSFDVATHGERDLIARIAERARKLDRQHNGRDARSLQHHRMNITACHANGNPLRLEALLEADDFNFAHDVFGIDRHIDRDTGHMMNFFRPRYSRPEHQDMDRVA